MEGNLVDLAKAYLTPDVIQRASALVGESTSSTERALDVAIPSVIAGLAGDTPGPAEAARALRILGDSGLEGTTDGIVERLGTGSGEELIQLGRDLLDRIFGSRKSAVIDSAAAAAGVKGSSMSSLLALAAPLVLGALGREKVARGLDMTGIAALLGSQKRTAEAMLPQSILRAIRGTGARPEARSAAARPREQAHQSRLWPLLLVLIPAVIVGALLLRRGNAPAPPEPRGGLGVGLPKEAPAREVEVTLPSGEKIKLVEGSIGYELARFLATPDARAPARFVFDGLVFDTASGRLTAISLETVDRVATVLNAYPSASVLLEGHTDNTGDPAGNVNLSVARAEVVKKALVARGVSANRISTAGHGQERPIAPNDTDEGRAKNRRTEIVITQK